MKKRKERIVTGEQGALTLAVGEALGMGMPTPEVEPPGTPPEAQGAQPKAARPGAYRKAVLQRARAGGGKWVVRVLLTPAPAEASQLEELAREARRALGTGARVEEGVLMIQGDIPDRVEAWLRGRGVEKVVR